MLGDLFNYKWLNKFKEVWRVIEQAFYQGLFCNHKYVRKKIKYYPGYGYLSAFNDYLQCEKCDRVVRGDINNYKYEVE